MLSEFLYELGRTVKGDLRTDQYNRLLYSTDASLYQALPHGVLIPRTLEDVQAAVSLAAKYKIPLLPRAGGSSLAGQTVNTALVVDMTKHLNQVLELNAAEQWVRVQPGLVLDELNSYLRPHGLQFGPDPASSNRAGLGGIVGNNATGSHSILYGMAADHVLETKVLLSDGSEAHFRPLTPAELAQHQQKPGLEGELYRQINALVWDPKNRDIIRAGTPTHWRRCGGYGLARFITDGTIDHYLPSDGRFNLSNLMVSSEGTLAFMTEMKLKLVPRPKMTALAIVEFADLHSALEAVPSMLETKPSAIELLDNLGITMAQQVPEYARLLRSFLESDPFCVLLTEFYGESEAELQHKLAELRTHIQRTGVKATAINNILAADKQANVWKVRKVGLGLLMSVRSDYKPIAFIEDTAVPVQHLAEYIPKIEQFCESLGTKMTYYAHASAGCLHIRPMVNTKLGAEIDKMPKIQEFVLDLLGQYGGTFSSEHGDGRARSWLNEKFFGKELYGLFQQVKQSFDPHNLFNPGNIVSAPPMTENLRYGANYQSIPLPMHLHFPEGFGMAVEMCNGAGVCRKVTTGGMCPSYMATREEEDSTRGRANMLRAVLSGRLPQSELTSPRMYEVLELCVSCKACKSECPSSVDMAKIKTEFLAQYYDVQRRPWRDYLFAHIGTVSKLASGPLAPLVNFGNSLGVVRRGLEKGLGISAQRTLPQFARRPFTTWFKNRPKPAATQGKVVLFNDTLSTYSYPEVAQAAVEVLEAAGYEIVLPGVMDAGRPAFSKGLVKMARRTARTMLDALTPLVRQRLQVIFLEPSDLSMLTDDYASLLPDDPRVQEVAQACVSFEQFVAQQAEAGQFNLEFKEEERHILLHGHCHQKALTGTKHSHKTLTLPPHYTLTELDTACCGMAGTFGYEAEHLEVSLQMGERRLFPAVRSARPEVLVVAPGLSCRQQIKHGTGKMALHPAQLLRQALKE